ncbi:hypothetical protein R6Q57_007247 [Mikania cordata]
MKDRYSILENGGEGTLGTVYKSIDQKTGALVALKETRPVKEGGVPPTAIREIGILQLLSTSRSINRFFCVEDFQRENKTILYLVFEYLYTDLKKLTLF